MATSISGGSKDCSCLCFEDSDFCHLRSCRVSLLSQSTHSRSHLTLASHATVATSKLRVVTDIHFDNAVWQCSLRARATARIDLVQNNLRDVLSGQRSVWTLCLSLAGHSKGITSSNQCSLNRDMIWAILSVLGGPD